MNTIAQRLTSADWDTWWASEKPPRMVSDIEQHKFLTRVRPRPGMTAVDIGCGNGRWTGQLARWGMDVTGYDLSPVAVRQAQAGGMSPLLRYEVWDVDAASIPLALSPGSIDVVTLRLSISFIDRARFLVDAARWLRPETGTVYALINVDDEHQDQEQNRFRRGLTEKQIASLGYGWAHCDRYSVGPRTAVVLRGYCG